MKANARETHLTVYHLRIYGFKNPINKQIDQLRPTLKELRGVCRHNPAITIRLFEQHPRTPKRKLGRFLPNSLNFSATLETEGGVPILSLVKSVHVLLSQTLTKIRHADAVINRGVP